MLEILPQQKDFYEEFGMFTDCSQTDLMRKPSRYGYYMNILDTNKDLPWYLKETSN
jgi:hypothetical protein